MPQKRYTVQAPDGRTVTLEGPDGASQEEVVAQAQRLLGATSEPPPLPSAPIPPGLLPARPESDTGIIAGVSRGMQTLWDMAPINPATWKSTQTALNEQAEVRKLPVSAQLKRIGTNLLSPITAPMEMERKLVSRAATGDLPGAVAEATTTIGVPLAFGMGASKTKSVLQTSPRVPPSVRSKLGGSYLPGEIANSYEGLINPGVSGKSTAFDLSRNTHNILRQTLDRLGLSWKDIATSETAPRDFTGNVKYGVDLPTRQRLASQLGKSSDKMRHVALEIADEMVRTADAPMQQVYNAFATENMAAETAQIAAKIRAEANAISDPVLRRSLLRKADLIESKSTVREVADLKAEANKKSASAHSKSSPIASSNAELTEAGAWRTLGDEIRETLYSTLEDRFGVKGMKERGVLESDVMKAQTGLYKSYRLYESNNPATALQSGVDKYGREAGQFTYNPKGALVNIARKYVTGTTAMHDFNALLRDAMRDAGLPVAPTITFPQPVPPPSPMAPTPPPSKRPKE